MQQNYLDVLKSQLEKCNDGNINELFGNDGEWACEKIELRTLFDKYSNEWHETTLEDKMTVLKMIADKKIPLSIIITAYQYTYRDRNDILKALPESLAEIIDYMNGFHK